MSDYISIDQFNQGWNFFTKKITNYSDKVVFAGKFSCSDFSCSGCDDWLDADNQNRNVDKLSSELANVLLYTVGTPNKGQLIF